MIAKFKVLNNKTRTKRRTLTNNWSNNKQQINNNRTIALERTAAYATWGGDEDLNAFYWYQIFAIDSVVVKSTNAVQSVWRLPNYCNVSSQRNNLIKLTHYDYIKKRAHDSQIVQAKENLKLSNGGHTSLVLHSYVSCLGEYI